MAKIKLLLMDHAGWYYYQNHPAHIPIIDKHFKIVKDLIARFNSDTYEVDLIAEPDKEYDVVVVTNNPHKPCQQIKVRKGNVFVLMQEPPLRLVSNFMYKNLRQYDQVFSPIQISKNTKLSHPYLGWYFDDYETHQKRTLPKKTKLLSCIMSNNSLLPGHSRRLRFLTKLKQIVPLDHFGRGFKHLENKGDGLLPYYYSIAIENYSGDYYFTEKINDCFLAYTVPLYYGCTNIDKFFPRQSYIKIDINDIQGTETLIKKELNETDYKERLPYLKEAREIVLKKYHIGSFFKYEIAERIKTNLNNPIVNHELTLSRNYWSMLVTSYVIFIKIKRLILPEKF